MTLPNLSPWGSGASCLPGNLPALSNKLSPKYKTMLMFNVMLNLPFKITQVGPTLLHSSNQGSLQEMTLSVFQAVIHEGCSHVQPTLAHSYTYLDTGSGFRRHIGGYSIILVEATLTHVCNPTPS